MTALGPWTRNAGRQPLRGAPERPRRARELSPPGRRLACRVALARVFRGLSRRRGALRSSPLYLRRGSPRQRLTKRPMEKGHRSSAAREAPGSTISQAKRQWTPQRRRDASLCCPAAMIGQDLAAQHATTLLKTCSTTKRKTIGRVWNLSWNRAGIDDSSSQLSGRLWQPLLGLLGR